MAVRARGRWTSPSAPWSICGALAQDKKPTKIPSDELITQTRQKTGLGNLHVVTSVDADTLQKDIPNLYVNLSAIAKGFGVDKVAEYLESLGARNYLVEIGGELRINGVNGKGHPWRVAIEKPTAGTGTVQEVIVPGDNGVATSGDYRNYYELDGQRFSHTIDPRSGKPNPAPSGVGHRDPPFLHDRRRAGHRVYGDGDREEPGLCQRARPGDLRDHQDGQRL